MALDRQGTHERLVDFMYLISTRMLGEVTVGNSGV